MEIQFTGENLYGKDDCKGTLEVATTSDILYLLF